MLCYIYTHDMIFITIFKIKFQGTYSLSSTPPQWKILSARLLTRKHDSVNGPHFFSFPLQEIPERLK